MQLTWVYLPAVSITAFILTALAIWFASRQGMYDLPGERHSHSIPTPRGGGLGIVSAVLLATWLSPIVPAVPAYWWHCLAPGFVILAITGFLDDRFSLPIVLRLAVQLAASLYLLACGHQSGWIAEAWAWIAAAVFIVWMTNLFNFMDGSNGMAAMQGIFVGLVLAILFYRSGDSSAAWLAAVLAASCAGFLPWNIGRARVFMGDVGSVSLGFLIAGLLLYGVQLEAFSAAVAWLVMVVFLSDSTLTLLARVIRGERWYTPHKQHLYQRLIEHGWSHNRVMWLYQLTNVLLIVPVIVVADSYPEVAEVVAISTTLALATAWFLALRKFGVLA